MKGKLFLMMLVVLLVLVPQQVLAQSGPFDSPLPPLPDGEYPHLPPVDLGGMEDYVASVGIGAVIMVAIEILKRLNVVPDGQAGRWATIANVIAFAGLVVAGVFGVDYSGDQARAILDLLERVGQAALMIISSPLLFRFLREAGVLPLLKERPF